MNQESEFVMFLASHLTRIEPLYRELSLAEWDLQTTSSPEAKSRSTELTARYNKIYADPKDYAFLCGLNVMEFTDPLLKRQHALLLLAYQGNQMDPQIIDEMVALSIEIADVFNTYRPMVRGKEMSDNEIDEILIASDDAALRQESWEASKKIGEEVEMRLRELVRMRNREAQRLGFENFYSMSLELDELNEERLFTLLEDLAHQSAPLWAAYKSELDTRIAARFGITPEQVRPWHHADRFFQETGPGEADLDRFFADKDLEEITRAFFADLGLPVTDLLQKSDLYERPGKCQHAFCLDVDRQGDVRVLCNNRPNERWMSVMLHEFGHAIYDKFLEANLPYLLRCPAHTLATEAIALFMGRLTKDTDWLARYAGVEKEEAERISEAAQREVRDHLLVFMRWCLVMTHFERALYRNPEQDLNTLWWDLVEMYQGVLRPEGRNAPDWAAKIHLATAPVYYHNYQLGEMVASQLLYTLHKDVLKSAASLSSPEVGDFLKSVVFRPGRVYPWETWLMKATGETLNPRYFVSQLQSA